MSINSGSLSGKEYDGGNFTPTSRQALRDQNTSVGLGLFEVAEFSDSLNYKPFFK